MFLDCKTELERNEYKRSKKLQQETDNWLKKYQPEFYKCQRIGSYNDVFDGVCRLVDIPRRKNRFVHFVDYRYLFDTTRGYRFENLTPDFSLIVTKGLLELKYPDEDVSNDFCRDYNRTIDSMVLLTERIAAAEEEAGDQRCAGWFWDMKDRPAQGFEEALQRILFADQLFWQMGHRLIGLGHLDQLLWESYQRDLQIGAITRDSAKEILCDFLYTLHEYYWLKSNVLMGDTGQIILVGTKDMTGNYSCNELSYVLIEALMQLQLPDPKILLRVSRDMPRDLMELALKCMQTGIGSPILSNDDVVIPKLIAYGVEKKDAYQYGTSACWEPLIPGRSISPNNIGYLSYPKVMQRVWEQEAALEVTEFEQWMQYFYKELEKELDEVKERISEYRLQYNPLLSVFIRDCYANKSDVSTGGAAYNNFGITTVGLSNTINAIFNLKLRVFEEHSFTLKEVRNLLQKDFEGQEKLRQELKSTGLKYGSDRDEVISLTNKILRASTNAVKDYRNYLGGGLKLGVSAPSYIDAARDFPATFDGRHAGDAFGVHISSESGNGYTELINFAAGLDYGENRFNGNVVDFMVSPHFIEQNFDKMTDLLTIGVEVGFFQLQMNVVGSETLIAARKNPEKYQNLIVRVWGFSAYFHELPREYQDVLIRRALENEGKAS
jgi:formate C-acetyltransferase